MDTKFVERHRSVLAAVLDHHLPPERVLTHVNVSDFARRYGLRPKPDLVRWRSFHPGDGPFGDMTVRVDELAEHPLAAGTVFAVENAITFLAFPAVPGAAVLFGGGLAVSRVLPLTWLRERDVVYRGDLDTHGFAILDGLRAALPDARSLLMGEVTLLDHREHWAQEASPTSAHLPRLTAKEQATYRALVTGVHGPQVRLEQERVRFGAVRAALRPWMPEASEPAR